MTAFIEHSDCVHHDTGLYHPERPDRFKAIRDRIADEPISQRLQWRLPDPAPPGCIEAVHGTSYIRRIEEACLSGSQALDQGDTLACPDTFRIAELAAGAALEAVDAVLRDGQPNAFSALRPPGHHARPHAAMGFCIFNNIAIAARYAQRHYGLRRVLILDWDVHHGNGTQEIFYEDPGVFFCSAHQYPFYPGTGAAGETGAGAGEGSTLNLPLERGACGADMLGALSEQLAPRMDAFEPEIVLVSAGFDAHRDDPLGELTLTDDDFAALTSFALKLARRHCGGRLVSILEGGYNLDALARSVLLHLETLAEA